jgi:endonuclease YncB( thermonuclease family)
MKRSSKGALRITFFLLGGLCALAQDSKLSITDFSNDPCGNPLTVSTAYILVKGKVLNVIDGETLLVELTDKKRKRIKLIGVVTPNVESASGKSAKEYLANLVLGKPVEISFIGIEDAKRKQITAQVSVEGGTEPDVNRKMLRAGLARYKEAGSSLDWYLTCQYKRAENDARAARRGLWAGAG